MKKLILGIVLTASNMAFANTLYVCKSSAGESVALSIKSDFSQLTLKGAGLGDTYTRDGAGDDSSITYSGKNKSAKIDISLLKGQVREIYVHGADKFFSCN